MATLATMTDEFLRDYPGMSMKPPRKNGLVIEGLFEFRGIAKGRPEIIDEYQLRFDVPRIFPKDIPSVTELGGKIPRDGKHHVNPDNSLCLGSPLRVRWKSSAIPTLVGFAENCVVPYLYGTSHKLKFGSYPFDELDHGAPGVIRDYLDLLGLKSERQIRQALTLLGMKKRVANKKPCPCDCGKRLSVCNFRNRINTLRNVASRAWFKDHLENLGKSK